MCLAVYSLCKPLPVCRCWKDVQQHGRTNFLRRWMQYRLSRRLFVQRPVQMEYVARTLLQWAKRIGK